MADTPETERPVALHSKRTRSAAQTARFLQLARDRFKQSQSAESKQRDRELQDLRFYAGEQWPEDVKASRAGQNANNGMPPVPARPCITINKTRQPVREVLNQERGSDIGIEIVPADDFGDLTGPIDETEIKLREGLVRRIQRESQAADARTWAFARATIAGRGYYMVMTRYVPGKTNDQEIYVHRIYNQACVSLDPAHEQPDGSDAEWEFLATDMPWARYKAENPRRNGKKNALIDTADNDGAWRQLGDDQPDWFRGDDDTRFIRVVDYFYTERVTRTLCTLADGTLFWDDELPDGAPVVDEREVVEKQIKWAKIDGSDDDVLEETDWPGPDMPIVKVLGEELQPYDDERRAEGMVRPMREPGQGFNVMVSKMIELIGLTPIPSLMMAEGQDEGYEQWYIAAATRTLPKLPYKQKDIEGNMAPPPFSVPRDPAIGPVAQAIGLFDEALQSTSLVSKTALGETDASVKSAKHANLLREQAAQGTSNYMDNLMRSMRYEGQIVNNLLYPIYGRPGRIARILNGQGEPETLLLHQPMVMQGTRPVLAPENDQNAKKYTLTKDAKFNVGIKITKNFDFRREQEASTVGELISQNPTLMTWFGDLYFKNLDGPGHDEMADRTKVMLDPKILAQIASKQQGAEIPPQVQAELQQSKEQLAQVTQVAQQLQQQIDGEAAKEQAETERKNRELAASIEKAKIDAASKLEIEKLKAATQLEIEELKLRGAAMQREYDAWQARMGAAQVAEFDAAGREHEVGMAAVGEASKAADRDAAREARGEQFAHESAEAEAAREAAEAAAAESAAQGNA